MQSERRCETCGNTYDKPMLISLGDEEHVFDCFECAIHGLAPRCAHCGCAIIGHGVEDDVGEMYCCAHCAHATDSLGVDQLQDRAH